MPVYWRAMKRSAKAIAMVLAVVPVERDACGGCFNAIPPQKQSEIKQHKKVMVCENCGRILVDEELAKAVVIK